MSGSVVILYSDGETREKEAHAVNACLCVCTQVVCAHTETSAPFFSSSSFILPFIFYGVEYIKIQDDMRMKMGKQTTTTFSFRSEFDGSRVLCCRQSDVTNQI
jgi:hypothetical protein